MTGIKQIILYKHGMGYFERMEKVRDNDTIRLEFKKSDMNDLLKSLSVHDNDGGIISSISYDTSLPTEQEIKEIGLTLPYEKSLSELLANMRGARVSFKIDDRDIEGIIVGTEEFDSGKKSGAIQTRLILWNGTEFNNYNLLEIEGIRLLDEKTKEDFQQLLHAVFYRRRKSLNELSIFTKGEGEREVFLGYTLQTPVWKTSYRISLLEEASCHIQGWAMIDNTREEDWKDVKLSLVSGLPISFQHDLHSPRYRKRPVLEIEERAEYDVPLAENSVESFDWMEDSGEELAAKQVLMREATLRSPEEEESGDVLLQEEIDTLLGATNDTTSHAGNVLQSSMGRERGFALAGNFASAVGVGKRGIDPADFYIYEIDHPVTVHHDQSALVPILSSELDGKQVAFYDKNIRSDNPMTALFVKNDTGMVLEGGPVTVYGKEEYLGEGMLHTLAAGDETILPFAVELACQIEESFQSRSTEIIRCKIENGTFQSSREIIHTTVYIVNNTRNKKHLDLFLDHPITTDSELSEENRPYSRSKNNYRFRMDVAAGEKLEYRVEEQGETTRSFSLLDLSDDRLENYLSMNIISDTVSEELKKLMETRSKLKEKREQIDLLEKTREEIFKNQERIRENLKVLGEREEDRDLRSLYLKQLNEDEETLIRFHRDREQLENEKRELQRQRNTQMKQISYQSGFE